MTDINNTCQTWYLKNKERVLEQRKEYYLKNRESIIEYQKKYRKDKINNDYKFRTSIIYYQSRYYQNRKRKIKEEILHIDCNPCKNIDIDINDTIVLF